MRREIFESHIKSVNSRNKELVETYLSWKYPSYQTLKTTTMEDKKNGTDYIYYRMIRIFITTLAAIDTLMPEKYINNCL